LLETLGEGVCIEVLHEGTLPTHIYIQYDLAKILTVGCSIMAIQFDRKKFSWFGFENTSVDDKRTGSKTHESDKNAVNVLNQKYSESGSHVTSPTISNVPGDDCRDIVERSVFQRELTK